MMKTHLRVFGSAILALLLFQSSYAGTIIKLSLSDVGPDIQFNGGVLSTVNDGDAGTTGEQDSGILFTDFLSGMGAINGSFTLHNAAAAGPAQLIGGLVVQNFAGGNFQIYNAGNVKLLDVNMTNSVLTGGPNPTGAFFNISNGVVVGGTLAPLLNPNSVNMSMSLTQVSGGQLLLNDGLLAPFTANATVDVAATPEPASAVLAVMVGLAAGAIRRRRAA